MGVCPSCSMSDPVRPPVATSVALFAGAVAGASVDTSLYPIDTIKTRLQSKAGFWKAGGFTGVYRGLSSAIIGSAPGAALFFGGYEGAQKMLRNSGMGDTPLMFAMASSMGEVMACLVRVPTENVKQNMQMGNFSKAGQPGALRATVSGLIDQRGVAGMWRGYSTTVMREIPFSFIQFPIFEGLKQMRRKQKGADVNGVEGGLCGSFAGAIAAAITTPLDVAKTRIMLGESKSTSFVETLKDIHADKGASGLFAGVGPRVFWISLGGFVFLGAYEQTRQALS